jgi:hypothetical protein
MLLAGITIVIDFSECYLSRGGFFMTERTSRQKLKQKWNQCGSFGENGPMADPLRQAIPTPEQLEALTAGFGEIGVAAQLATARMVDAFAAAARRQELENQQRDNALRKVLSWFSPEVTLIKQNPTIGRKRRARRARGRQRNCDRL